jgi:plastocyanin
MGKTTFKRNKFILTLVLAITVFMVVACGPAATTPTTTAPATTSPATTRPVTTTPASTTPAVAAPTLMITSPSDGSTIHQIGDVMVTVTVTNFTVVDKQGQSNVPGEGHLHYYLDAPAPTTPGQPAIPPADSSWAHVASTSYTFTNVPGGEHTISVQLVNNNHTPLVPPVVATSKIMVVPEIGPSSLVIVSPRDGATLPAGDVTVTIQTSNFSIVDKQGQANTSHEGHIHYYLDVEAPTTPGQPAIPLSGEWAHVASTTYTFATVAAGSHTISVQLINNDHTPLEPPVVASIAIKVAAASLTPAPTPTNTSSGTPATIALFAQGMAFNLNTITAAAGVSVTINFDNRDTGIPHNFSLYTNSSAAPPALFQGQIINGPATATYTFTAPVQPGTYFFRCDIHPTTMTGSFVVQ